MAEGFPPIESLGKIIAFGRRAFQQLVFEDVEKLAQSFGFIPDLCPTLVGRGKFVHNITFQLSLEIR
jgi:hypothetical protein